MAISKQGSSRRSLAVDFGPDVALVPSAASPTTSPPTPARAIMALDTKGEALEIWRREMAAARQRDTSLTTISGREIEPLYLPDEITEEYETKLGFPGQFPYTR